MWIQVRTFDGKKMVRVDSLSKLTKVEELREKLVEPFDAPPERQRLFYRGKQLEDGHSLFDYSVGLNDLIQIMVRNLPPVNSQTSDTSEKSSKPSSGYNSDESDSSDKENKQPVESVPSTSQTEAMDTDDTGSETNGSVFKIGDIVDARDVTMGAWFEAKIIKIRRAGPEDEVKDEKDSTDAKIKPENIKTDPTDMKSSETAEKESTENADIQDTKSTSTNTDSEEKSSDKGDKNSDVKNSDKLVCDMPNDKDEIEESNNNNNNNVEVEESDKLKSNIKSEDIKMESSENDTKIESSENDTKVESSENDTNVDSSEKETQLESSEKGTKVKSSEKDSSQNSIHVCDQNDGFVYSVLYEGYEEDDLCEVRSNHIRPRAQTKVKLANVEIGQKLMVNFNYDEPDQRGYWYDCVVTSKRDTRTIKELTATVYLGKDLMPLENCKILFVYELFEIEKIGSQINQTDIDKDPAASPVKRTNKPECDHCLDNPRRKCKFCACHVCGGKDNPGSQIMCDECDMAYDLHCLDPPLDKIPEEDEWYCPECKNDSSEVVKAGEKLKGSKKKSKMASATSTTSRDWGKGMACVGRTKECRIVPPNHFGPVPGVEVGTQWKFRVQASESGCHRPHVAGIHGREEDGAFSIVLSGGYEDDMDNGDLFTYTGSGGRDLSGNKRTAEQSCDQKLTRMNRALAKNCNAPLDAKTGTEAKDWKGGKPVRVIRNCKGRKHSKYAPEEGNRYDGIYKIVKYWSEKGKSGFLVWRYMLRRDDPNPAPWTKAGKKRSAELGLVMQYPAGYLESQKEKLENAESAKKSKGRKRKASESDSSPKSSPNKKSKLVAYKLASDVKKCIGEDVINKKLWDEALECRKDGGKVFLEKVEELLLCICCQEIVYKPVTTECHHNLCLDCLKRSFKADVYTCPACRTELGKDYSMPVNKALKSILTSLFPGYEAGR